MKTTITTLGSILLSGINGFLFSVPMAFSFDPQVGTLLIVVFTALGLRIGYMKRRSRPFFYFSLFTTLILLSILSRTLT
jgi:hypothetical protein